MTLENNIESLILLVGGLTMFFVILAIVAIIGIIAYIYTSIALYTIAKKLKIEPAWLAWVPVANLALVAMCANRSWTWVFAWFLVIIPFFGWLALVAINVWFWWVIAEKRKISGALSLLQIIQPIGYWVMVGIIAWRK
jgi:hypothetical protein